MEPDEIMLMNAHSGRDITPPWDARRVWPLVDSPVIVDYDYALEHGAAFASDGSGVTIPDPHPYVKLETPDGRPGIEVGIRGTF